MTDIFHTLSDSNILAFSVKALVALFVIVDAIGNVPVFMSLLERFEEGERRSIVKKAVLVAGVTLVIVSLTGQFFFRLLGVELYSFRIAGGILLTLVSLEMLQGKRTRTQSTADDERYYTERDEISIIPLAIPLLTGPGALTTGIVFFHTAGSLLNRVILLLVIGLVYLSSYLILIKAGAIFKYLGKTGTRVAVRIMGLMLLSVGVQFVVEGITEAFPHLAA
jgi:multiple antibiotic resistance protein